MLTCLGYLRKRKIGYVAMASQMMRPFGEDMLTAFCCLGA